MAEYDDDVRSRAPDGSAGGVQQAAGAALDSAGSAVRDTAGTAKEQAGQVAGEARTQARRLVGDVRDRAAQEARTQNDRLADGVRRFADELDQMAADRGDSPASKVVAQVSQGGRRIADYLAEHGPEGVLEGVQDFARRRPGTFLLAAAATGFVVGRLGKGVLNAEPPEPEPVAVPRPVPSGDTTTYAGSVAAGRDLGGEPIPVQPVPVVPAPVEPVPAAPLSGRP
jgi:uncharacterized protein YjbJ (UPF0337 family)